MRLLFKNAIYLLLLCTLLMTATSGCFNNKKRLIKKLNENDVSLSDPQYDEQDIRNIERLLDQEMYGPALAELKAVLSQTSMAIREPKLFILLSEALMGLGREEDAQYTLRFAKSVFNHHNFKHPAFKKDLRKFLNKISDTGPLSILDYAKPDTARDVEKQAAKQQPLVTNSFYETDLRQALFDISMQTGVTIVWDESVDGTVTYEAVEEPLEDVLHHILFANGYTFVKRDGLYYIGSADVKNKSFRQLSETHVVSLSNMDAREAVTLLADPYKPYVNASQQSNLVGVTAPPVLASRIISDLEQIDRPRPQVEIEAVVVEFATSKIKKLGTDWNIASSGWNNKAADFSIATPEMGDAILALNYLRDAMKIKDKVVNWSASIKALSDAGVARIRATPRIRTIHGQTALLSTTKEQYFFITSDQDGGLLGYYNRLETIRSGINIEITPYVDKNNFITVQVKPQVDDVVGEGASGLPEISRRNADTRVRVKDGETITIGGLRVEEDKQVQRGVPVLSQIPLLGYLFSRTETEKVEKELVIFVTPHVLTL